jgi:hypothetical protein
LRFLAQVDKLHSVIQKNRTAFAHIFATGDRDDCLDIVGQVGNAFVIHRINQDVAVAQDKWTITDEILRKMHNATCPILHCLGRVLDCDIVARTVTKKFPHSVSAIPHDNKKLANSRVAQSFYDVLQNWFAAHLDHWLGNFGRKFAHSRPAPGSQHDSLVNLAHRAKMEVELCEPVASRELRSPVIIRFSFP